MSQQHLFRHAIKVLCICERLNTAEQLALWVCKRKDVLSMDVELCRNVTYMLLAGPGWHHQDHRSVGWLAYVIEEAVAALRILMGSFTDGCSSEYSSERVCFQCCLAVAP